MKKLSKLKLKEFHEMSDSEMKYVVGGYSDGNTDPCFGKPYGQCSPVSCTTSSGETGKCSVKQAETQCKCRTY